MVECRPFPQSEVRISPRRTARTWPGTPLVKDVTKSLTQGGVAIPANPTNSNAPATVGKSYTYDTSPFNWLLTETDKVDGRLTTYNSRDALGRVLLMTDVNGNVTALDYDGWGRVWHMTRQARGDVAAVTTTFSYAPDGSSASKQVSSPGLPSLTTTAQYDAFGRVIEVDNPDGSFQTAAYDGFGQKIKESPMLAAGMSHYGDNQWIYDEQGRLSQTLDPQTRTLTTVVQQPTWMSISADGQTLTGIVSTVQDDRGFTRSTVKDLLGQKVAVVDQQGQVSNYVYDKDGHLTFTQQGNEIRRYTYNDMGWLLSRSEPEEGSTTYGGFSLLGTPSLTTQTGRNGQGQVNTSVTWDTHLRPVVVAASAAGTTSVYRTIQYRDDFFVPQMIQENQPYGVYQENYDYDGIGRLKAKQVTDFIQTFSILRHLDALGNQVSQTFPGGSGSVGQFQEFLYDNSMRPSEILLNSATRAHMDYPLASGSTVQTVLTFGTAGASSPIKSTSTTTLGELRNVTHANVTMSQSNDITWSWGGLMLSRGSDQFNYDALQRLNHAVTTNIDGSVLTQDFAYDRFGNRTKNRATISSGNLPDEVLNWTATYDGTNSLPGTVAPLDYTTGLPTGSSLATGAQYDNLGRVKQVWAIPGNTASMTSWDYDASGRVVLENGTSFLLDGEGLRFKRMGSDGSIQYTVYGFNREPLSVFEQAAPASAQTMATLKAQAVQTTTVQTVTTNTVPIDGPGPISVSIGVPRLHPYVWVGMPLTFVGAVDPLSTLTTYFWTFGDGSSSTVRGPSHTYAAVGTYTVNFTASDPTNGTGSDSITITVLPKPVISNLVATPSVVYLNPSSQNPLPRNSTLSWTVSNTDSLTLDQGIGTVTGISRVVTPNISTTYTLSAINAGGTVTKQVAVAVNAAPPPTITSFTCNRTNLVPGQTVTLSWQGANYNSLSLAGIGAVTGTSITLTPTQTTTYTLVATNGSGRVSQDLTVSVLQIPVISAFFASSATVTTGQSVQLSWGISNFNSLSLVSSVSGSPGSTSIPVVLGVPSVVVNPTQTTTYTLTASNTLGSSTGCIEGDGGECQCRTTDLEEVHGLWVRATA